MLYCKMTHELSQKYSLKYVNIVTILCQHECGPTTQGKEKKRQRLDFA